MRKRLIIAFTILNVILAMGFLMSPAASLILPQSLLDSCCKNAGDSEAYCCNDCCLFTGDECDADEDCRTP